MGPRASGRRERTLTLPVSGVSVEPVTQDPAGSSVVAVTDEVKGRSYLVGRRGGWTQEPKAV